MPPAQCQAIVATTFASGSKCCHGGYGCICRWHLHHHHRVHQLKHSEPKPAKAAWTMFHTSTAIRAAEPPESCHHAGSVNAGGLGATCLSIILWVSISYVHISSYVWTCFQKRPYLAVWAEAFALLVDLPPDQPSVSELRSFRYSWKYWDNGK